MRAIEYRNHGGPGVLGVVEAPIPAPGRGQVRVKVKTVGVNGIDWKIREGYLGEQQFPQRPGVELAGIVDVAGPDAPAAVGDEVFGWSAPATTHVEGWNGGFPGGAYAEYALAEVVIPKPPELSWTDAASLPVVGETARRGVAWLDLHPGECVLVLGGSGVVGSVAVQLAVAAGATVIATAGDANRDYVGALGATPIAYGDGLADRVRQLNTHVDAVLDAAGLGGLEDAIALRGGTDRIVTVADPTRTELGVHFDPGSPSGHTVDALRELADAAAKGELRVRSAASFPLAEAARAQELSATNHAGGKITLDVG